MSPGLHVLGDKQTGAFSVVWWDPRALKLGAEAPLGIRRPELIVKDVAPEVVAAGLATYNDWRMRRDQALAAGAESALAVRTVTQIAKIAPEPATDLNIASVAVVEIARAGDRPKGRRFGALMHAVLASVPLDGDVDAVHKMAADRKSVV